MERTPVAPNIPVEDSVDVKLPSTATFQLSAGQRSSEYYCDPEEHWGFAPRPVPEYDASQLGFSEDIFMSTDVSVDNSDGEKSAFTVYQDPMIASKFINQPLTAGLYKLPEDDEHELKLISNVSKEDERGKKVCSKVLLRYDIAQYNLGCTVLGGEAISLYFTFLFFTFLLLLAVVGGVVVTGFTTSCCLLLATFPHTCGLSAPRTE
eukprot:m.64359 g.64359  ORF g.64359 m.64359 type:complete len:207 (+) comp15875_c0_seq1:255-875(+)